MSSLVEYWHRSGELFRRYFGGKIYRHPIRIGRCSIATDNPDEARQVAILASCAFDRRGSFEINGHRIRWWSDSD